MRTQHGLAARGEGWYVVNAADVPWVGRPGLARYAQFEGDVPFSRYGISVCLLEPGVANGLYHREEEQEDFLVLRGECLLLVEGEERRLRAWDFVHCPAGTDHVFVGAGDGPCLVLMAGSRTGGGVVYPVAEVAQRHGASAEAQTSHPPEAYARFGPHEAGPPPGAFGEIASS